MSSCFVWCWPTRRRGLHLLEYQRQQRSHAAKCVCSGRTNDDALPVTLTTIGGKRWNLRVPADSRGSDLRRRASIETGIPAAEIALCLHGGISVLADNETLPTARSDLRLEAGLHLQLMRVERHWALAGLDDGQLQLLDLNCTGRDRSFLAGHHAAVTCLDVDWARSRCLSGSRDGTLKLWDLESELCVETLHGHTGAVDCVTVDWSGCRAISGSADACLKLWDLNQIVCLKTFFDAGRRPSCLAVDWLRGMSDWGAQHALVGQDDGTLRLWDLTKSKCGAEFGGHDDQVTCLAVDWESRSALSGAADATLRLWSLLCGQTPKVLRGHSDAVTSLTASWEALRAVSAATDKTMRVWDLADARCLQVLDMQTTAPLGLCQDYSGQLIASASRTGRIWLWQYSEILETTGTVDGCQGICCLNVDARRCRRRRK
eukprot:TRINITY_DN23091_c0_g1_i1.p1 TRINITY_DN23091_c0_g1~~TRINITY_DN23091_c0_g1_i1.p1  ORF type:complete len:444 (-),score=40.90 TRINITY_DN23091_c0_g1_i1:168-1460(-)